MRYLITQAYIVDLMLWSQELIYLYKRGKSPRAAKTAEIFFERERERET